MLTLAVILRDSYRYKVLATTISLGYLLTKNTGMATHICRLIFQLISLHLVPILDYIT